MTAKELLKLFNRKERNWLLRDALGDACRSLDKEFLGRVTSEVRRIDLGFEFDDLPYWVTDFHFDWLVGILHMLSRPSEPMGALQLNDRCMVKGNQEDIDLVIATGDTLLLIEAKGEGSWSTKQIESKMKRLASMSGRLIDDRGFSGQTRIVFLLCSPRSAPSKISAPSCPSWVKVHEAFLHFDLRRPADTFLKVARCNEGGIVEKATHWKILRSPHGSAEDEDVPT